MHRSKFHAFNRMFILFAAFLACSDAAYIISVYGDVYKDTKFFTETFPWIIDNIGGDITVDYLLQGSGSYSVPQMCALNQLRLNTFLQAQYLKCEAEGTPSGVCLCDSGVDPEKYKECVLTRGSLASLSSSKYKQIGIEASPIVEIGHRNMIFGVENSWYLKKICTIFGDHMPRGCTAPFKCCNQTEIVESKGSVVRFDCPCADRRIEDLFNTPTTSTTTTPYYYTNTYFAKK